MGQYGSNHRASLISRGAENGNEFCHLGAKHVFLETEKLSVGIFISATDVHVVPYSSGAFWPGTCMALKLVSCCLSIE